MRSAHRYICAGLAALTLGTALTGCSGISLLNGISEQTEGELGDTMSNMFFDFTVNSAGTVDSYDGYTPSDGNQLILCNITLKNTFGEALPMYDSDFQLQWGDGDEDYAWSVDPLEEDGSGMPTNDQMPLEWSMDDGAVETYDLLFEVPADVTNFSIVYLEQYTDEDGNDGQGDLYTVYFTV